LIPAIWWEYVNFVLITVLGSEGASSDSAPIGCGTFRQAATLPHIQMGSCHGAVMISLDSPEFSAEREQGQTERHSLRLWGLRRGGTA
jgi:hypothetical protein